MNTIAVFGLLLFSASSLRLVDIMWPTKFLHWGFYAVEAVIGITLYLKFS